MIATHFAGFPSVAIELHSQGNTVQGNFIGTDASGDHALVPPGGGQPAVEILGDGNLVGGTLGVTPGGPCSGACNVVAGGGVQLHGSGNTVQGNLIGTDVTGTKSLGSATSDFAGLAILPLDRFASGVVCNQAVGNQLGGTAAGAGNVIAAADTDGVYIRGLNDLSGLATCGATQNRVEGNLIGTDVTGTRTTDATGASFGNAGFGVLDDGGNGDVIGGATKAALNVISGSGADGVLLGGPGLTVEGNLIGTDITGTQDLGNVGSGIQAGSSSFASSDSVIADNVVSGNGHYGVYVVSGSSQRVVGNKIGTNAAGTAAIPNDLDGVFWIVVDGAIGGPTAGERNVVSGNRGNGIVVATFHRSRSDPQ